MSVRVIKFALGRLRGTARRSDIAQLLVAEGCLEGRVGLPERVKKIPTLDTLPVRIMILESTPTAFALTTRANVLSLPIQLRANVQH